MLVCEAQSPMAASMCLSATPSVSPVTTPRSLQRQAKIVASADGMLMTTPPRKSILPSEAASLVSTILMQLSPVNIQPEPEASPQLNDVLPNSPRSSAEDGSDVETQSASSFKSQKIVRFVEEPIVLGDEDESEAASCRKFDKLDSLPRPSHASGMLEAARKLLREGPGPEPEPSPVMAEMEPAGEPQTSDDEDEEDASVAASGSRFDALRDSVQMRRSVYPKELHQAQAAEVCAAVSEPSVASRSRGETTQRLVVPVVTGQQQGDVALIPTRVQTAPRAKALAGSRRWAEEALEKRLAHNRRCRPQRAESPVLHEVNPMPPTKSSPSSTSRVPCRHTARSRSVSPIGGGSAPLSGELDATAVIAEPEPEVALSPVRLARSTLLRPREPKGAVCPGSRSISPIGGRSSELAFSCLFTPASTEVVARPQNGRPPHLAVTW